MRALQLAVALACFGATVLFVVLDMYAFAVIAALVAGINAKQGISGE